MTGVLKEIMRFHLGQTEIEQSACYLEAESVLCKNTTGAHEKGWDLNLRIIYVTVIEVGDQGPKQRRRK